MAPVGRFVARSRYHGDPRPWGGLVLALCVLAPLLTGCGQAGAGPAGVSLLPDPAATGSAWDWTAQCLYGPYAHSACEASGPDLGAAQLNGDEWNLGGGAATAGSLGMSVSSPGALELRGDLPAAPPCTQATCLAPSANTWVRGYPNVLYGINQCHAVNSPPESRLLPLPMRVSAIPADLIGTTTYDAQSPLVTYDVAYDLWLNRTDTRRPCRTDGTVEVMVWTDYDQQALLPASMQVEDVTIPFVTGGVVRAGKLAWTIYVSNVFAKGQTAPWGGAVWFVLNRDDVVAKGTVSVDLSYVLSVVGALLQNNYGWSEFRENYWLDSVPFGMEFGPQAGTPYGTGSTYFSLRLSSYCLEVGIELSHATCNR
ncbi:MAG: GH12 family glycosyl hydrolase domain-containing protein [Acidimicrobiales bacterium]